MAKDKKGIEAIFGEGIQNIMEEIEGSNTNQPFSDINIKDIIANPFQPRKQFEKESLQELADSIKEHGILSPIMIKEATQGKYYLIAGERRTRAAQLAGLKTIPSIIKEMDDNTMQEIALIENIQREDLNPIEVALSYKAIMTKQNITQEVFAKKIGKSRSSIANTLRVLTLEKKILSYVLDNTLSFGHVKPLITLAPELALNIAKRAVAEKLTVRKVEEIVQGHKLRSAPRKEKDLTDVDKYVYVEGIIRDKIKSKVVVKNNKITIPFKDDKSLNSILDKLGLIKDE